VPLKTVPWHSVVVWLARILKYSSVITISCIDFVFFVSGTNLVVGFKILNVFNLIGHARFCGGGSENEPEN
jgi:hypothetical protein